MIFKSGSLTVTAGGSAQNLELGFIPSYFYMVNQTNLGTPANNEIVKAEYFSSLADGYAITTDYTASQPATEVNYLTSNGFTAFTSSDSQLWVPDQAPYNSVATPRAYIRESTNQVIDNAAGAITQASNALVTMAEAHSFTSADVGVTVVTFHGVPGMKEINGLSGVIQSVPSTTTFTVNIDTSNFTAYTNGQTEGVASGFINVITGAPATTLYGNVNLPTASENLGYIGLTLGSSLMTTTSDVWLYYAMLQSPATGP